jgi:phosphatidylglycerol:prolipoprotein diacylglycerol transferase
MIRHVAEAFVYKILVDFGSLRLDPLYIVLVVASLLLLAMAQSFASAKKMKLGPALVLNLAILVIGDGIVYFLFMALFRQEYAPDYVFPHVSIYSYGFMLMLAFIIGTIWFIYEGKKEDPPIETDTVLDLMVFIIIGSIIGARLVYIATQYNQFKEMPKTMLQITQGGLSIHGGVMGAMLFAWIYTKAKGLDFWRIADIAIPGVPLGMFFGRIGCFLNGCCYGNYCLPNFPLRVKFPDSAYWTSKGLSPDLSGLYDAGQAALKGANGEIWRHPAQLYEAFGALAIFWYLMNFRNHKVFKGHVFLMFVWLYSLLRFFVEMYRFGDPTTGAGSSVVLWKAITMAQVASLILAIVAWVLIQDLKRRAVLAKMLMEGKEPEVAAVSKAPAETEAGEDEEEEEDIEAGAGAAPEYLPGPDEKSDAGPESKKDENG